MILLHQIEQKLSPLSSYKMLINGQWVESESKERQNIINPATGEVLSSCPLGCIDDVNKAVSAAKEAFNMFGETSPTERQRWLLEIADRLEAKKMRFATLEALNCGKPYQESLLVDLPTAIDHFRYFAGVIRAHSDSANFIDKDTLSLVIREPIGVVGQVIPWNYPLMMAAWKLAPALAAGNTVVINPAYLTPVTLLELGEILNQVLPAGVVNIVTGRGSTVGQRIIDHPDVGKVAFTGSTDVGYQVAKSAAAKLIPATLELGGKSANIVFPDANINKAVKFSVLAILMNQGQSCESGSRLFIHQDIYDEFLDKLKIAFASIIVGDPMDEKTQMGSQISESHLKTILDYIEIAKKEGATLLTGGERLLQGDFAQGCFMQPTILTHVTHQMRIVQEEIFGPVLCVFSFKDEKEVIELANDSEYGLAGAVWTQDINRAIRVSKLVKTGRIWVNTYHELPAHAPFGGYKKSGLGRETHKMALDAYTQVKNIFISTSEGK